MKYFSLLVLLLCLSVSVVAQPENIKRIIQKNNSGQELTEAEEEAMDKWMDSMDEKNSDDAKPATGTAKPVSSVGVGTQGMCPKPLTVKPKIVPLTREGYVTMAKSLMAAYGPKVGSSLPELKGMLESSDKSTDGSDMGAMFMMVGAGSATIYSTAWSAAKNPDDLLTANNLGVALKDMGEFVKALQILMYADKLKPNIALVITNMGWVYREMGDADNAIIMFNRALQLEPEMSSAQLGLGLAYECQGNHAQATVYLRKALAASNSAVGIAAYRQSKAAQPESQSGQQSGPVSSEKGSAENFSVPDLPISEDKGTLIQTKSTLTGYQQRLSSRMNRLITEYQSLSRTVRQQSIRAKKDADNSIVFSRDFSRELFMLQDINELLWGENSNWGMKVKEATKWCEKASKNAADDIPVAAQMNERMMQLLNEQTRLMERYLIDLPACGDNDPCCKKVEAKLKADLLPITTEMEEISFRSCKLQKGELDIFCAYQYKAWNLVSEELKRTGRDYYAFTNPILEKIYSPSFNELLNIYREIVILTHQQYVLGMALGLPDLAEQYNELVCVEPEPPVPPSPAEDPELPKKKQAPCPLGDGISGGVGALSFELSCDHVKLSGGEGLLWSVSRDFNKHETKIWGGVGAKAEYGNGNLTGEATVGVELTIGQGDVVKDVALTSSVKAGLGGLVETEISGRLAVQGGPAIEANAGFITPDIPGMGK